MSLALWLSFIIPGFRRETSFMRKNVAYRTKEKWGVQNKMQFKKKAKNNSWALRKKIGVKSKKLVTRGIRKKCSISKIGYF